MYCDVWFFLARFLWIISGESILRENVSSISCSSAQIMVESTENNKQFANSSSPQIEEEELQKLEKLSM